MATGALALVALETVLQPQASGRLGTLLELPASWAHRFLDPSVPALHKGAAPPGAAAPHAAPRPATPDWSGGTGGDWTGPPPPRPPHRQGIPTN